MADLKHHLEDDDEVFGQRIDRRRSSYSNLGVFVSLAGLTLALMLQFGYTIWWGATMSADQRHVIETLSRMESERYTKSDAARDIQRMDQRDVSLEMRLTEVRNRVLQIEDALHGPLLAPGKK